MVCPYFFLSGHCSARRFLISAVAATLIKAAALINTATAGLPSVDSPQPASAEMGLGKAERQGQEEVVFESWHKLVISSPDNQEDGHRDAICSPGATASRWLLVCPFGSPLVAGQLSYALTKQRKDTEIQGLIFHTQQVCYLFCGISLPKGPKV